VTAVDPTANGHLTLYSEGANPPTASTVNFVSGVGATGNATLVGLSSSGQFSIYAGGSPGTVHAVADVLGYYVPSGPVRFNAVAPCRLFDTRVPPGGWLMHDQPRSWQIKGNCGVSPNAVAVTATITAVAATWRGSMVLYPAGTAAPATRNLNFPASTQSYARANGTLVKLGLFGPDMTVKAFLGDGGHVDLTFDVTGYYE
jgi:hypothetical protein